MPRFVGERDVERVANGTAAALREVGRGDLADLVRFYVCGRGWYLEPLDVIDDADDLALMDRAVDIAQGLRPEVG
jgi:hypothetical protein